MRSIVFFLIAALGEISGCYAVWIWLRQGKSILWLLPGMLALALFAIVLTRVNTANAGRAYAAYGGIYILSSLLWLWLVEGVQPDRGDWVGVTLSLAGTLVILLTHS